MAYRRNRKKKSTGVELDKSKIDTDIKKIDIDLWLQRASHFSQFGLFLFTIGTIYFTVIPLYQKAVLEEQIAKKEIKLSHLEDSLESAYKKIRNSVVFNLAFNASVQCSGVLISPKVLNSIESKHNEEEKNKPSEILAKKPYECLLNEFDSSSKDELNEEDKQLLKLEVSRIGTYLEKYRIQALSRYEKSEETVSNRPLTMPTTGMVGMVSKIVLEGKSQEFQEKILREIAVKQEKSEAENEYSNLVRSEVTKILNIQWPKRVRNGL